MIERDVGDEHGMETLGRTLARAAGPAALVFLRGELGAGKTTLVRGFLRELGATGAVRSPTFTLVETYVFPERTVHHFDFYRLKDSEEMEFLGARDMIGARSVCLVEWPERAEERLPPADLEIKIEHAGDSRRVTMRAGSAVGERWLEQLK